MLEQTMRGVNWVVALVGLGLSIGVRADDAFGPLPVLPAAKSFSIGTLKLTALHDAQYVVPNDGKTFGVGVSSTAVSDLLRAAAAPTDRIALSVNALLVRSGRRVLLIDTGLGPKAHGSLVASLSEAGVSPKAVTDILITHSHGDHIGGLLDANGALEFPKATIRMASAEWAWLQKNGAAAKTVEAISGHVRTFEPGAQIAPGVTSVALAGHTPGHVGYEIVSGESRLLDIGDVAHSSIVSLEKPDWGVAFDSDGTASKTTRLATLARLEKDQELVYSPHFPFPGVGHIVAEGNAFAWKAGVP
jgi:glyoxylase-like metal-dependent hydrolase (beta-lactamase superfamily II)